MEREAAARGDDASRVRLLVERLRTGDLSEERLRLAIYLGDEVARGALPAPAPELDPDLGHWVRHLWPWGQDVCVRAGIAAAELLLAERSQGDHGPLIDAVTAARAWALCPCLACLGRVREVRARASAVLERRQRDPRWDDPAWADAQGTILTQVHAIVRTVSESLGWGRHAEHVARTAATATSLEQARAAVRDALMPIALGLGDPLR
jgi:hypothetical protein